MYAEQPMPRISIPTGKSSIVNNISDAKTTRTEGSSNASEIKKPSKRRDGESTTGTV
jgi:hypothetical protein